MFLSDVFFSTLCLDDTMDEWLTDIDEVNVPNAWADDGWYGMAADRENVCCCRTKEYTQVE